MSRAICEGARLNARTRIVLVIAFAIASPHGCRCGAWPPTAIDSQPDDEMTGDENVTGTEGGGNTALMGAVAGADQSVCAGASATLGAAAQTSITYLWQPATWLDTTNTAQPVFSGAPVGSYAYTLIATDSAGTTNTTNVTVTVGVCTTVAWTATATTSAEGTSVTLTINADVASAVDVVIPLSYSGSASAADFAALPATITLPAGQTSVTLTLAINDDVLDESDETLVVTIGTITGVAVGTSAAFTVTITDNDSPPFVSIADAGFVSEAAATAAFPVTLNAASGQAVRDRKSVG